MADDNLDEDLFADLYDGDDTPAQAAPSNHASAIPEPVPQPSSVPEPVPQMEMNVPAIAASSDMSILNGQADASMNGNQTFGNNENEGGYEEPEENYGPIGIKEDG